MPKVKKPTCPEKTAVAYARYSSAGQRDVSIDQQLADIRSFAAKHGYRIVHEYADHAKSGFKNSAARAAFQAMLADAPSGSFDTVIAWKVARFGRNREESALYKKDLRQYGVSVVYAMEYIPSGAAGVLTEGMLESIAEWYSRNLSENVSRGMLDNARKAIYNGILILGYKRGPDGRYVIDEEQAAVVRKIYDLYLSGYSAVSIADELAAAGVVSARGRKMTSDVVLRVIASEYYMGVYSWGDVRVPGGMPVIIPEETWRRAQLMRKKTSRHIEKSPADFLLTGKVFCGLCGKPMVGDSGKSRNGSVYYYYNCTGHKSRAGYSRTCGKRPVRKDDLEEAVLDFVYDRCLSGPEKEKIADAIIAAQKADEAKSPLAALRGELKDTEKKISNINDAIENGVWNSSTSARLKSLEDSADHLRDSIAEMEFSRSQLLDRERILFFLSRMAKYDRNNDARRRQLVETFINSVFVHEDKLLIVINAVEGAAQLTLADIPPELQENGTPDGSDVPCRVASTRCYPNHRAVIYVIPFQKKTG